MSDGWERLVELARRQAALVDAGSLDELPELWAERDRLLGALGQPPATARDALLAAREIVSGSEQDVRRALEEAREESGLLTLGRRAAAGYGGLAQPVLDLHG